jgi:hypothetical protein
MMRLAALALLALAVLPGPARAMTINITRGYTVFLPADKLAEFSSLDFFSTGTIWPFGAPTWEAFGVESYTVTYPIRTLRVGTQTCRHDFDDVMNCGEITFMSRGLPAIPPGWPLDVGFVASVPFTAIGRVNVDGGYTLVGRGILTGRWCRSFDDVCSGDLTPSLTYRFTAAEPEDALLPLAGTLVITGMLIVHRRRQALSQR